MKDIHRGRRCFIIGNGPSLKQTDLTRLRDEFTFGMNRIYLGFPEMGFQTSYFLTVNSLVIEQCAQDIRALTMPRFVCWRSHGVIGTAPDLNFMHTTYTGPKFATDARGGLWESATVTYVALQLAYHMGFEKVILIGVDHTYSAQGRPNTTIVSQGEDRDHFNPNYFGKGFRWCGLPAGAEGSAASGSTPLTKTRSTPAGTRTLVATGRFGPAWRMMS